MIKQALQHYLFGSASCIAMFAFLGVFLGTLFWVNRKDAKKYYSYIQNLPLDETQD